MISKPITDIHKFFASYFNAGELEPYLYLLSKKMSEGHICIPIDNLKQTAFDSYYTIPSANTERFLAHQLISDGSTYTPFILYNRRLYTQRYFSYESNIIQCIQSILDYEHLALESNLHQLSEYRSYIKTMFHTHSTTNTDWQLLATLSALINQFSIITGGPGTGKTTTVSKILSLMLTISPNIQIALAAPTGKAANRMAESLKQAQYDNETIREKIDKLIPSTLHRLLGSQKNSIYFKHNAERPLPYDLIIIDESSMIDISLFSKLLSAIHPSTKVILLGDKDQLASVEAGSIFGDLCNAEKSINTYSPERAKWLGQFTKSYIPIAEHKNTTSMLFEHITALQHSHRFSTDKGIGRLSKAIINNDQQTIQSFFNNQDDEVIIDENTSEIIFNKFTEGYKEYLLEKDIKTAFFKLNSLRILCAVREGNEGVINTNIRIEKYLQSRKWIYKNTEFYENRPIIITKNNYELGLFNGDTGIVKRDANGNLKVWFENTEGGFMSYQPASIEAAETVFAMTIHKSQGSEFDNVMVLLPKNEDTALLTCELIYTAVTRAKSQVIIQGSHGILLESSGKKVQRGSGLEERLSNLTD